MKGKLFVRRLSFMNSYAAAYTAVIAVYYAAAAVSLIHACVSAVSVLVKSKDRRKHLGSFFHEVILYPEIQVLRDFRTEMSSRGMDSGGGYPNILKRMRGTEDTLLSTEKIKNFQRKVYSEYFKKWLKINCPGEDLDVLSRHSSPVFIGKEIERIAGTGRKNTLGTFDLEKISFAYRTYLKVLRVRMELNGQGPSAGRMAVAERMKKLYPVSVEAERITMGKGRITMIRKRFLQKIKMESTYIRFSNTLTLQTLLVVEKQKGEKDG